MKGLKYEDAGVNISAGNEAVNKIKESVQETFNANVLTGLGSFGSSFSLKSIINEYDDPVLVQSIDGVGTKTKVAVMCNDFSNLGYDLFSAATNDIVVMGAKPLTFLDYVAFDSLNTKTMKSLVDGMSRACKETNVALVGGETAEMPGVYVKNEIDMVGIVSGIVDKNKIITGDKIQEGNTVFGLTSSGLHTNGYSFARKLFFEVAKNEHTDTYPELNGENIGKALLKPHINYTNIIREFLEANLEINGMAHITGGGFIENIPRVLPNKLGVTINKGCWDILPIFKIMQKIGNISDFEMYRSFNMGIGMVIIGDKSMFEIMKKITKNYNDIEIKEIGMVTNKQGVEIK